MTKTVTVVITRQTKALPEKSFGIPCLFTTETPTDAEFLVNTSRAFTSEDISTVGTLFGTNSETYKAVQALLRPNPKIADFRIFRRSPAVARVKTISFGTILSGQLVKGTVNGTALTNTNFTNNVADTLAAVASKIALVEGVQTATVSGGNSIIVTAAIEWDLELTSFGVTGTGTLPNVTVAMTTTGNTQADDLNVAIAESDEWYCMLSTSVNDGAILCTAAAMEPAERMALLNADNKAIIQKLEDKNYSRTAVLKTHDVSLYSACTWASRCLALPPGKVIFGLKSLSGVSVDPIQSSNDIADILAANGNVYVKEMGATITKDGKMSSGDYIDIIRDLDFINFQIALYLFKYIVDQDKVPFIDPKIQGAVTVVKTVLNTGYESGINTSDYVVTAPTAASIPANIRAGRSLPDLKFVFNIQGAIQSIQVNGTAKV